jgi:hypothetical protein
VNRPLGIIRKNKKKKKKKEKKKERQRGRERKKIGKLGGGGERRYDDGAGVKETIIAALKVPRQCPLVLLIRVRLVLGINSILILIFNSVGGAAFSVTLGKEKETLLVTTLLPHGELLGSQP